MTSRVMRMMPAVICVLSCIAPSAGSYMLRLEDVVDMPALRRSFFQPPYRVVIQSGSGESWSLRLADYLFQASGERLCNTEPLKSLIASPNGERFVFGAVSKANAFETTLLLLDCPSRSITRMEFDIEIRSGDFEWVSDEKVLNRADHPLSRNVVFDISAATAVRVEGGPSLVFSKSAEEYSLIIGEMAFYRPLHGSPPFEKLGTDLSSFLMYSGKAVYPFVREAPVDEIAFDSGIATGTYCYDLSGPAFLGDSRWVGFLEQVYTVEANPQLLESNVVALRPIGGRVDAVGDVEVVRNAIPPFINTILTRDIACRWNEAARCLEVWRRSYFARGWDAKVAEIPMQIEPLQFGEFRAAK